MYEFQIVLLKFRVKVLIKIKCFFNFQQLRNIV